MDPATAQATGRPAKDRGVAFYYVFPVLILFLYQPGGGGEALRGDASWGPIVSLALALLFLVGWLRVGALREAERHGARRLPGTEEIRGERLRRVQRHQTSLLLAFLVAWFVAVHVLHLPGLVPRPHSAWGAAAVDVLLLVPFYGLVLLVRWAAHPAVRVLRGIAAGQGEYLRFHLRAMAIFALPPLAYVLVFRSVLLHAPGLRDALLDHPGVLLALAAALILVLLALAPVLVRHLFPREPLDAWLTRAGWTEEERVGLRDRLVAVAGAAGARLGPILVWRTGGLQIANAAVAGLLSRYQRVFVSDALLGRLGLDELMAVFAHELGHVRLRHPLLNYLLAISAIGVVTLALALLGPLVDDADAGGGLVLPLLVIALNALYLVTILRLALNRFERQADALAAEAMDGAAPFVSALLRLVAHNVTPAHQGSITHPPAARRIEALRALGDGERRRAWLARERWLNRGLVAVALVVLAAAAVVLERM